MTYFTYHQL